MRKLMGSSVSRALIGILVVGALAGCNKAASNAADGGAAPATSSMASGAAAAASGAMTLVEQLGGMNQVVALADAFGANLSANPVIGKFLDAAAIGQTKLGLVNEIAKASGMAPPNPGADLMATLSGKGLDAEGVSALTGALSQAADQVKVGETQKAALMGLVTPMMNQLGVK